MTAWNITRDENGKANVAAFVNGSLHVADDAHPNFTTICEKLISGEYDYVEISHLFDIPLSIGQKFKPLTRRVSVSNNALYFDGEPMHSALADVILRAYGEEGNSDWQPLVNFLDKVQDNPNRHSRENLFRWLDNHDFGVRDDGNFLAYKGVNSNWLSQAAGTAIVNGAVVIGNIPYEIGSVVEMPRGDVEWDPERACSTGLHAGTYAYAKDYARNGRLVLVSIDPADVVSVPTDCDGQKLRVCRLTVVSEVERELGTVIVRNDDDGGTDEGFDDVTDLGEITAPIADAPDLDQVEVQTTRSKKRDRDDKIRDAKAHGMSDRGICKEFKVGRRKLHKILKEG
jgi:hypothetical protein